MCELGHWFPIVEQWLFLSWLSSGLKKPRIRQVSCFMEGPLICLISWITQDKMLRCGALSTEP